MSKPRWVYVGCFALSLVFVAAALHRFGAAEIRANADEVLLLTLIGGGWLALASALFSWFGLSLRDDAIERRNSAALLALCGALIAMALVYIGGSLGEGPSYWNNIFSAGLGTAGLLLLWVLLEWGGKVSISIAEERDAASGIRLCGFLMAIGLILGRAVAGDWHSEEETVRDFALEGWPAGLLCAIALVLEWRVRPSRRQPFPKVWSCGLVPALFYLGLAGSWLWYLGPWEGMFV